jgi:hypothetical protein
LDRRGTQDTWEVGFEVFRDAKGRVMTSKAEDGRSVQRGKIAEEGDEGMDEGAVLGCALRAGARMEASLA